MSMLGRKWPVPVARPMYPFWIAGSLMFFAIWKAQTAMMQSDEFKNDPRNPNSKGGNGGH